MNCALCGRPVLEGPAHVVVHGMGDVCWRCSRERDPEDWGLDQFEAIVARMVAARSNGDTAAERRDG